VPGRLERPLFVTAYGPSANPRYCRGGGDIVAAPMIAPSTPPDTAPMVAPVPPPAAVTVAAPWCGANLWVGAKRDLAPTVPDHVAGIAAQEPHKIKATALLRVYWGEGTLDFEVITRERKTTGPRDFVPLI
jgi:hypothetical protein